MSRIVITVEDAICCRRCNWRGKLKECKKIPKDQDTVFYDCPNCALTLAVDDEDGMQVDQVHAFKVFPPLI